MRQDVNADLPLPFTLPKRFRIVLEIFKVKEYIKVAKLRIFVNYSLLNRVSCLNWYQMY